MGREANFGQGEASSSRCGGNDFEGGWQRSGWKGRYTGGFFGSGGRSGGAGGSRGVVNQALQQQLQVLGLAADASGNLPTEGVVRSTYRKLALQAHPDKPGGSKIAFQELQNAYEAVLSAIAA